MPTSPRCLPWRRRSSGVVGYAVGNVGFRAVLRAARAVFRPVLRVARATFRPVLRAVRAVLRAVVFLVAIVFLPFCFDVAISNARRAFVGKDRLTYC